MKTLKIFVVLCLFHLSWFNSLAGDQTDSTTIVQTNNTLENKGEISETLRLQADSIHRADSLEQIALKEQIANLHAKDQKKKEQLQARLDSMHRIQQEREVRIKLQVDSLRKNTVGVPVVILEDTIFKIYSRLGPFHPSDRAASIQAKINALLEESDFNPSKILISRSEESHDVMYESHILFSVTDRDAFWSDLPREEVAKNYTISLQQTLQSYQLKSGFWQNLKRIFLLILVLAVFFFGFKKLNQGISWVTEKVRIKVNPYVKGFSFKGYEILSKEREEQILGWLLKIFKWLCIALVGYLSLPIIFSIFPATKGIATSLFGYVFNPIFAFVKSFIGFIPELITIIVIILLTRYFVRFLKFLSGEVATGKLQINGFYPDWANPTFNILRIVIYAFSFVVIFPYLPGSNSPIFQGVSVFLGLLISLGSSTAIGNIIAGLVITYMRAFRVGDRVQIGETTGDVIEKTMLVTRVRTIKNEDITIPNMSILNGRTINYSSSAKTRGLILNRTVSIGYDVPWKDVHQLLIDAALKTELIQNEPLPFVHQTSLDDFYVSYQINGYTEFPEKSAGIVSELYANIQDAFNNAGIEILSPHYRADRDGNASTIPVVKK